jgi:hypothetical protein
VSPLLARWAAVGPSSDRSGTVYGVGSTPEDALEDGTRRVDVGQLLAVRMTEAAFEYVTARGGAASEGLRVGDPVRPLVLGRVAYCVWLRNEEG